MALPRETDPYGSYTDQLVYFSARLAATPETATMAETVNALVIEIDEAQTSVRLARRAEVRARAQRDHQDDVGDLRVRRFKRRVDVFDDSQITTRLFPNGLGHTIAPRGRPQIERLSKLAQEIERLGSSPAFAAHEDADEIKPVFDQGLTILAEVIATLTPTVAAWEAQTLTVAQATDVFKFRRADGVARMGVVMGELRAKLGGDQRAAYAYTQAARTSGGPVDDTSAELGVEEG